MPEIFYRKAEACDRDALIALRIAQLQEQGADPVFDLRPNLYAYYCEHMASGTFVSWFAESEGAIVGTSGMSFVEKPPYYENPCGKIGLLSGMYTLPPYRRRGIARTLLERVIGEAKVHGCRAVQITASEMGVLLYTDYGFHKKGNFMQYDIL